MLREIKTTAKLSGAILVNVTVIVASVSALDLDVASLLSWIGLGVAVACALRPEIVRDAVRPFSRQSEGHSEHSISTAEIIAHIGSIVVTIVSLRVIAQWHLQGNETPTPGPVFTTLGIVCVLAASLLAIWLYLRWYSKQYKKCPDCAEYLPAKARVCRCCSFRFE